MGIEPIDEVFANGWGVFHLADNVDDKLGSTRVLSNQRGYPGERTNGFEPGLIVEV
jgi:hypothetical protein